MRAAEALEHDSIFADLAGGARRDDRRPEQPLDRQGERPPGKTVNFSSSTRTEYAGFGATIDKKRRYFIFIGKTLTPALLLVLVVFSTLFFPPALVKEKVTLSVTGILTSAVETLIHAGKKPMAAKLDTAVEIVYVLTVVTTVFVY